MGIDQGINYIDTAYPYHLGKSETQRKLNPNTEGAAALCTGCGACIKKCPQDIDIPTELEKVHAILDRGEKVNTFLQQRR